jgi:methyl-accepting chemotaxis protein
VPLQFRLSGGSSQLTLPVLYVAANLAGGGLALALVRSYGSVLPAALALLSVSLLVGLLSHHLIARRQRALAEVHRALGRLAHGDVSGRLAPDRLGDLAETGAVLNQVTDVLAATRERMASVAARLVDLPQQIADGLSAVRRSAEDQEAAVEETAALHANINASIRNIGQEVEKLALANDESASSILELGSAVEQVASSSTRLQETVESSTSALHQVGDNIKLVAMNTDSVQAVAEETAASVTEMDRAIQEVGTHVRGASELTDQVKENAERGSEAVGATIDGIAEIRQATLAARTALEGLAERIGEIGEIATVIGAITDETNLLSLNAAIIAAQAGEHGKAFAVVAGQVKTLARRTSQSTQEIEGLIEAIQEQSRGAVGAMAAGIEAVEQGVSRSRVAGQALDEIRGTAREASGRVAEIARAAEEQARNSKLVAEAARRTSEHVQEISKAMSEQSGSTETLLENATTSVQMCRQMTTATTEQRNSAQYITGNIESITEMIRSIQASTRTQEASCRSAAETVMALLENAREGAARVPILSSAISELREQAELMGRELERLGGLDQGAPDPGAPESGGLDPEAESSAD